MSKYTGRINRIFLKTHYFVSTYDLQLLEKFYKALLDEAGVSPVDFKKECDELTRLHKKYENEREKIYEILNEAYKQNPSIYYAFEYLESV